MCKLRAHKGDTHMKIAAALVLISFAALAEEAKTEAKKMSPEEQAMMDKYMKAATPGPEHQQMAKMVGKWNLKVTAWMAPGGDFQVPLADHLCHLLVLGPGRGGLHVLVHHRLLFGAHLLGLGLRLLGEGGERDQHERG